MALLENVHTLAGRLATFEQSHLKKRRGSSSIRKKTAHAGTWPHKTPTPEALARAGFYFKPTSTCPDNVTCFVCECSLDGWEPADEPAIEHLEHSQGCGWATYACVSLRLDDPNRREEDPSNEKMVDARLTTFRGQWPHENKKGWRCKTKKMVDAGWCYDPTPDVDDAVTCFYCGLALDGWEPKDDPMEEHRRRSPGCYFFNRPVEVNTATEKPRGKKGRQSKSSQTSRLSTQSNLTSFSEAPSFMSIGDPPAEDDSVLTAATTATATSMTGKGRKKGRKPAAGGKKTKKTNKADAPVAKAHRSIDDRIPDALRPSIQGLLESSPVLQERPSESKGNRKDNAAITSQSAIEDASETEPRPKRGRAPRSKTVKNKQRLSEDESQLHSELQAAVEASLLGQRDENTPRGKKRTSEEMQKDNELHGIVSQELPAESSPVQPKRARREAEQDSATGAENGTEESLAAETRPKVGGKGRKGKKAIANVPESSLASIPQGNEDSVPTQDTPDVVMMDAENNESAQYKVAEVPSQQIASPPPRQPTASISPQSSDAENHPPSSKAKPAYQQPPVLSPTKGQEQAIRVTLAAATPVASPSKRNVINGRLVSAFPWRAADLETVFLGSPDKENVSLTDTLRTVSAELTSPEKKMSVEEWIKHNASKGEEKLRRDCERHVGIFETEGVRALKSLEGIECI